MEWNLKSPPEWEWENAAIYGGSAIEMDRDLVDNGSTTYSSADLGMGSSSKSSISTYVYPSSKEGTKNFEEIDDRCPKYYRGKEEYPGLDRNGNFQIASASSIGSGEPMIGLKLGRHSYFEEMGAASTTKGVSFSVMPASSSPSTKRAKVSYQSTQSPCCQVEGCNLDLVSAKDYHRRHRICEAHSKSPKVIVAGLERRFCQQCSRFHDLSEFDEKKRSCRRRLSDHNARRRRPQPEVIQFSSTKLSSSLYDQNPRMSFLLNRVPIPVSNHIWESGCNYRGGRAGGDSLVGPLNGGVFDRKLNFPNNVMPIAIPMPPLALNHGSETSAITASNFHVAPNELHRALSLLSTNSRALNDSEFTSLHHHQQQQQQLTHENTITTTTLPHQLIHSESQQNWALSSDLYNNVGSSSSTQFQEFHLFKSPHIPDCFYSNHIN